MRFWLRQRVGLQPKTVGLAAGSGREYYQVKSWFPDADEKHQYVQRAFNGIARHYDVMNLIITGGLWRVWQRAFLRMLPLQVQSRANAPTCRYPAGPPIRILDVATGTGELAILMGRKLKQLGLCSHPWINAGPLITGIDFSREMLAVGQAKVRQAGLEKVVRLEWADALSLPFPDNTFDLVTSGWALRNFSNLPRALREMVRVAKPGGQVFLLEMTKPELPGFKTLYYFYLLRIMPLLGRLAEGKRKERAYAYLPQSLLRFVDRHQLEELLRQAGLVGVGHRTLTLGTVAIHYGAKP